MDEQTFVKIFFKYTSPLKETEINLSPRKVIGPNTFSVTCFDTDLDKYISYVLNKSLKNTLENISDSMFLLCPIYNTDFQLGVTGTYNESDGNICNTLYREVAEELRLHVPLYPSGEFGDSSIQYLIRHYNIDSCELIKKIDGVDNIFTHQASGNDDKTRRISCCVYGTFESVLKYLKNVEDISSDNIDGVAAIPMDYVKDYLHRNYY